MVKSIKYVASLIFILMTVTLVLAVYVFYKSNPHLINGYYLPIRSNITIDFYRNIFHVLILWIGSLGFFLKKNWGWYLFWMGWIINFVASIYYYLFTTSLFSLVITGLLIFYTIHPTILAYFKIEKNSIFIAVTAASVLVGLIINHLYYMM